MFGRRLVVMCMLLVALSLPLCSESYTITDEQMTQIEKTLDSQDKLIEDLSSQIKTYSDALKKSERTIARQSISLKILGTATVVSLSALGGIIIWQLVK